MYIRCNMVWGENFSPLDTSSMHGGWSLLLLICYIDHSLTREGDIQTIAQGAYQCSPPLPPFFPNIAYSSHTKTTRPRCCKHCVARLINKGAKMTYSFIRAYMHTRMVMVISKKLSMTKKFFFSQLTGKVGYLHHWWDCPGLVVDHKEEKRCIRFGLLLNLNQLRVPLINLLGVREGGGEGERGRGGKWTNE